jgi:hypothetical protein
MSLRFEIAPTPLRQIAAAAGLAGVLMLSQTACDDGAHARQTKVEAQSETGNGAPGVPLPDDVDRLFAEDLAMCTPDARPKRLVTIIDHMENRDGAVNGDPSVWAKAANNSDLANSWFPDEYVVDTLVEYTDPSYAEQAAIDARVIDGRAASISGAGQGIITAVQVLPEQNGRIALPFEATLTYSRDTVCPL